MPVTATAVTYAIIGWVIVAAGAAVVYGMMTAPKSGAVGGGNLIGAGGSSPRYGFGALQNTTTSELPLPILYGTLKMYGNNVYQSEPGASVKRAICICMGEVTSITDVKVNDTPIEDIGSCSYTAYLGTETQDQDERFAGKLYGMRRFAYLAVTLTAGSKLKGGNPVVSSTVAGTKVRTPYAALNWTNTKYSNNPSACVLDFLTNQRYGCGLGDDVIDFTSFYNSYLYCDGQVEDGDGGLENRFELDMVIDSQRSQLDILGEILATFGGFLVWAQGKLFLNVEKEEVSTQDFDEDTIIQDSAKFSMTGKDEFYNRIKVLFLDPENEYTKVYAIAEDLNDQVLRNDLEGGRGVVGTEVQLMGITRQSQALRVANFFLRMSRVVGVNLTFKTSILAVHCEPGDVISVTLPDYNWDKKQFRILSIAEMDDDNRLIECREHYGTLYTDSYGGDLSNYTRPVLPLTDYETQPLPNPTDVDAKETVYFNHDGAAISDLEVTWDGIKQGFEYFDYYQVELRKVGDSELARLEDYKDDPILNLGLFINVWTSGDDGYTVVGYTKDEYMTIPDVESQATYIIRVKTVSTRDYISDGAYSANIITLGKQGAPAVVQGLTNTFTNEITLAWTPNTDVDLWGYEIRTTDVTWASGDVSNLVFRGQADTYTIISPGSRAPGTYYCRAIDRSGNYSVSSASTTPTNAAPAAPVIEPLVWFGFAELNWVDVTDPDLVSYDIYVSRNNTWGSGDDWLESKVVGTRATILGDPPVAGSGDSGTNDTLTATELVGSGDRRFEGDQLAITRGTGRGQTRQVIGYDAVAGTITGDTVWDTNPDATSEWLLTDKRWYRVYGVDTYGSGDASNVVSVEYKTLTADMFGDEVIKARNLYAGEILTLSAQIRDAIINNAHIINLSVTKLIAGTLAAGSIVINESGDIRSDNYVEGVTGFKLDGTDGLEINSGTIYGAGVSDVVGRSLFWYLPGSPESGDNASGTFIMPFDATIKSARGYIEKPSSGDSVIVDVDVNGSSIWASSQWNRIILPSGDETPETVIREVFDTTTIASGDEVTIGVDQIGSLYEGEDISIQLDVEIA